MMATTTTIGWTTTKMYELVGANSRSAARACKTHTHTKNHTTHTEANERTRSSAASASPDLESMIHSLEATASHRDAAAATRSSRILAATTDGRTDASRIARRVLSDAHRFEDGARARDAPLRHRA